MITRTKKEYGNFVQADKLMLNDMNLSWKAKGLFTYMLSMPNDWKFYCDELAKHSRDGLTATRSAINELIQCGYIKRELLHDKSGKIAGYSYSLRETTVIRFYVLGESEEVKQVVTNNELFTKNNNTNNIYMLKNEQVDIFLKVYERYFKDRHRNTECTSINCEIENFDDTEELYTRFFEENKEFPERCNIDYFNTVLETRYSRGL